MSPKYKGLGGPWRELSRWPGSELGRNQQIESSTLLSGHPSPTGGNVWNVMS